MKVRPIDLRNLHPKLQVVLAWIEWNKDSIVQLEITSTWRNDPESVHHFGRGADIALLYTHNNGSEIPLSKLASLAKAVNDRFEYGKDGSLVAVDETTEPADPAKAAIWGPHIHLQVRDETSLR